MANGTKYFIGNWKMFGIPSSYKIIDRVNGYFSKDKKNNEKYKVIFAPPFTLLQVFSDKYKKKKLIYLHKIVFIKIILEHIQETSVHLC